MDFIKESLSLLINTNEKTHEKELCLRNTRALRVLSLRLDRGLVSCCREASFCLNRKIEIPSKVLHSLSKIQCLNLRF